jgi:hypothetical protein
MSEVELQKKIKELEARIVYLEARFTRMMLNVR